MLALSGGLNPECEHIQGDMRTLRLERLFDTVFVHDAVTYMLTGQDLRAAIVTAFAHTRPEGSRSSHPTSHARRSWRAPITAGTTAPTGAAFGT